MSASPASTALDRPLITPHLWFDHEARAAAERYVSLIPDSRLGQVTTLHDTPSGDAEVVTFDLAGQRFMAISAGPLFRFNPTISFLVACDTAGDVDRLWHSLAEGGTPLVPLGSYPFSARYGWVQDRFGLSWQLSLTSREPGQPRITPTLMFTGAVLGQAQRAVSFYTTVFKDSSIDHVIQYQSGAAPDQPGTVMHAGFTLNGQPFAAMDSARRHDIAFNEAISFVVHCRTQDEIDYYWDQLTAAGRPGQCGWLADRFGVSWQVTSSALGDMLQHGTPDQVARVTRAFLAMKKMDVAALTAAYEHA